MLLSERRILIFRIFGSVYLALGLALFSFWRPLLNHWAGFPPLLLLFLLAALSVMAWSGPLSRYFGADATDRFVGVALLTISFVMLLGHLALLGTAGWWILFLFLVLGLWLPAVNKPLEKFSFFSRSRTLFWSVLVLSFIFLLRALAAYIPQQHGDPLLYHLMGPRLWVQMGQIRLNEDLPVPLLAATWDYLYVLPQILFTQGKPVIEDLVAAQVWAQWIHIALGAGGVAAVVFDLVRTRLKSFWSPSLGLAVILAGLFVPSLAWTTGLAKNDMGVVFFCLAAWLYLDRAMEGGSLRHWCLGGVLAGLALTAKISAVLFLIPLAALILGKSVWVAIQSGGAAILIRGHILALIGFVLACFPVYFRNFWYTQNPFYTMFSERFPSYWVSQSWAQHFLVHQPRDEGLTTALLLQRSRELIHESPLYFFLLLVVPILLIPRARKAMEPAWDFLFLFAGALIVTLGYVMPGAELRYLGAALVTGVIFSLLGIILMGRTFLPRFSSPIVAAVILLQLALSGLPTHYLWKFWRTEPGASYVLTHSAGKAKAWLRENFQGRSVILNGDNEAYYLSPLPVRVLTEHPELDRVNFGNNDLRRFVEGLCKLQPASLILDVRAVVSLGRRFPSDIWDKAVVFEAEGARVFDLSQIHQHLGGGGGECGPTFSASGPSQPSTN
jgi:hypothetical protein